MYSCSEKVHVSNSNREVREVGKTFDVEKFEINFPITVAVSPGLMQHVEEDVFKRNTGSYGQGRIKAPYQDEGKERKHSNSANLKDVKLSRM